MKMRVKVVPLGIVSYFELANVAFTTGFISCLFSRFFQARLNASSSADKFSLFTFGAVKVKKIKAFSLSISTAFNSTSSLKASFSFFARRTLGRIYANKTNLFLVF